MGLCRNPELQANHENCFWASPSFTVKATKVGDWKKKCNCHGKMDIIFKRKVVSLFHSFCFILIFTVVQNGRFKIKGCIQCHRNSFTFVSSQKWICRNLTDFPNGTGFGLDQLWKLLQCYLGPFQVHLKKTVIWDLYCWSGKSDIL